MTRVFGEIYILISISISSCSRFMRDKCTRQIAEDNAYGTDRKRIIECGKDCFLLLKTSWKLSKHMISELLPTVLENTRREWIGIWVTTYIVLWYQTIDVMSFPLSKWSRIVYLVFLLLLFILFTLEYINCTGHKRNCIATDASIGSAHIVTISLTWSYLNKSLISKWCLWNSLRLFNLIPHFAPIKR